VTHLRKMMLEELQRRNYSQTTTRAYLRAVASFAQHFGKPPDQLGPDEIRRYQAHLIEERRIGVRTAANHTAALRFFYVKTLKRPYALEEVPYPKRPRRLPIVLSQEEAIALINSAKNLYHRAMLETLYSTGMRRAELCQLEVEDIDSHRMVIHIRQGKGGKDRDVPLSANLLETLRVLAVDAAPDVSVPRHGEQLARGQTHHHEERVGSVCGSGPARRHHQARESASAPP
jgi:integrase/recombinase XerD